MSTVTYNEAADALGVSRSTIERRLRLTGVAVEHRGGQAYLDLDTLVDAWNGRREAAKQNRVAGAALSVEVRPEQRAAMVRESERQGVSLSEVVRQVISLGLTMTEDVRH